MRMYADRGGAIRMGVDSKLDQEGSGHTRGRTERWQHQWATGPNIIKIRV